MRLHPLYFLVMAFHVACADAQTPTVVPPRSNTVPTDYQLVFHDDFDAVGIDHTRWRMPYAEGHRHSAGILSSEMYAQPGDGYLHLWNDESGGTLRLAMIRSIPTFRYGYFEARVQFQQLQGHHGAFWMQSPTYNDYLNDPARSGVEIDIIEFFGNGRMNVTDAKQSLFWNPYSSPERQERRNDLFYREVHGVELSADFHTFGLLWTETGYRFYVDGVEIWQINEGVSQTEQYLLFSLISSQFEQTALQRQQENGESLADDIMRVDEIWVYQ